MATVSECLQRSLNSPSTVLISLGVKRGPPPGELYLPPRLPTRYTTANNDARVTVLTRLPEIYARVCFRSGHTLLRELSCPVFAVSRDADGDVVAIDHLLYLAENVACGMSTGDLVVLEGAVYN